MVRQMNNRAPLVGLALGLSTTLAACGGNLPEAPMAPTQSSAIVMPQTVPPQTAIITAVPPGTTTVQPGTVVVVPQSGSSAAPPRLSASEIEALVDGNTASGTTATGKPYVMQFKHSGGLFYREGSEFTGNGDWRVTTDGQLCSRFANINSGAESCYTIYRTANTATYTYERPDGHPVGSFTVSLGS
jgi:hypothetical protein